MEANSPKEFLEKTLPTRFRSDKAVGIDIIAQLNLTGSNGGNWIVTIKNQQLNVTEGTHQSPTLTLTMTDNDFMDVVNRKLSVEKAFFTGKINFKGSIALALKLRDAGFL
jgi:putative sterol carrier protein